MTSRHCEQDVDRAARRYAPWLRTASAGLCWSASAVDAPATDLAVAGAVLVAFVASLWLRHRAGWRLPLALDVVVVVAVGGAQPVLGAASTHGWIFATASMMSVTCHYEWAGRPWAGRLLALAAIAAYGVGHRVAGGMPVAGCGRLLVQSLLTGLSLVLIHHVARVTDRVVESAARLRIAGVIARDRRAAELSHLAMLHDTAGATLLMISAGRVRDLDWVPAQAARDLRLLALGPSSAAGTRELGALLRGIPGQARHDGGAAGVVEVDVEVDVDGTIDMPVAAVEAIHGGVAEALTNVARHAGTGKAMLRARLAGERAEVEVSDAGSGFRPADVPEHRHGIRLSIVARAAVAGVRAQVRTEPGQGTTVRWEWSAPAAGAPEPAGRAAQDIRRNLMVVVRAALLAVAFTVQFGLSGPSFARSQRAPGDAVADAVVFTALALLGVACAVAVARRSPMSRALRWVGCLTLLLCSLAISAALPAHVGLRAEHWSFGLIGWYALVLLLDARPAVRCGFLVAHLICFATPSLVVGLQAGEATMLALTVVSITWLQIGVGLTAWVIGRVAATADRAAMTEERLRAAEAVAAAALGDHQRRSAHLRAGAVPLLRGLASAELDPASPEVRRRCGVEAARVRRLLSAGDGLPDSLVHELTAAVEVAERHGVTVELAVIGPPRELPAAVLSRLVEPVCEALVTASADAPARLTVLRAPGCVRVGLTCRPTAMTPPPPVPDTVVAVVTQHAGQLLWVEATWREPDEGW